MDAVREDMALVEVTDDDAAVRIEWRWKSAVVTIDGIRRTEKKTIIYFVLNGHYDSFSCSVTS